MGAGSDTITGGSGNDTIVAGGGHDLISGGGGGDVFVFAAPDSLVNAGINGIEVITDWVSTDALKVAAVGTGVTFYHNDTLTASTFGGAVTAANTQIATTHAGDKYAAVQVGSDVIVFIDSNASGTITTADDAILLTGRTLADIAATNFI